MRVSGPIRVTIPAFAQPLAGGRLGLELEVESLRVTVSCFLAEPPDNGEIVRVTMMGVDLPMRASEVDIGSASWSATLSLVPDHDR